MKDLAAVLARLDALETRVVELESRIAGCGDVARHESRTAMELAARRRAQAAEAAKPEPRPPVLRVAIRVADSHAQDVRTPVVVNRHTGERSGGNLIGYDAARRRCSITGRDVVGIEQIMTATEWLRTRANDGGLQAEIDAGHLVVSELSAAQSAAFEAATPTSSKLQNSLFTGAGQ